MPGGAPEFPKDLTLEINPGHPTIINLNTLRKSEPALAQTVTRVLLDHVMISGNLPYDFKEHDKLHKEFADTYLDEVINFRQEQQPASRREKVVDEAVFEPIVEEMPKESILKQAQKE